MPCPTAASSIHVWPQQPPASAYGVSPPSSPRYEQEVRAHPVLGPARLLFLLARSTILRFGVQVNLPGIGE